MTKMGMTRQSPPKPLKRKTPLKARKGLNKMSDKAKDELKVWLKVKAERIQQLLDKFGYIPCEYCKGYILDNHPLFQADAHHLDKNRRNNILENCRIVHRFCHRIITDTNIKDAPSLL